MWRRSQGFHAKAVGRDFLATGDVGYIAVSIKTVQDTRSDIATSKQSCSRTTRRLQAERTRMVQCLYPIEPTSGNDCEALENCSSIMLAAVWTRNTSGAWFGFRCGIPLDFSIWMLSRNVWAWVQHWLHYDSSSLLSIRLTKLTVSLWMSNPLDFRPNLRLRLLEEPYVKAQIIYRRSLSGVVMELAQRKRGDFVTMDYIDDNRVIVIYQIPLLLELSLTSFDKPKSDAYYASFDYELSEYRPSKLVKMDILLNGDKVDALSFIVHKRFCLRTWKLIVIKLKKIIPRQQFEVPIQLLGTKLWFVRDIKALS